MRCSLNARAVAVAAALLAIGAFLESAARPALQPQKPSKPQPQQEPPLKDEGPAFRLGIDLVLLNVTVVDPSNKPVLDLNQDAFQVFEDKVAQQIKFFSKEQVEVSMVFVIDTSGSMKSKLDTVIKASSSLAKEGRSGDEMAVVEFKEEPELLTEFTSDVNDITDTLQNLTGSGATAMLDALYLAADYATKEAKNKRRAVILVTDGLDKNSYYKFDEVVDKLREMDVQIYLIGFTNDLSDQSPIFKKSEKEKAESLLNRLATETGGRAFFPKELPEVHTIAEQVSTDLRTQYSIGYYPTNSNRDGTYRTVKVQVNAGNRRLVARTRSGYTSPREAPPQTGSGKP